MYLLSVKELFAGKTVQALCWALVHSLWIGLLLAAVAGIIILCTRKSRAALRYNLLTASFLSFSACIMIIFCLQLSNISEKRQSLTAITGTSVTENNIPGIPGVFNHTDTTLTGNIVSFFNEYATIIVFAWLLIIAFRLVGLIGGLYDLHKLKGRQLSDPGEYWSIRLEALKLRMGITKRIRLFQSGIAKIPMVLGHFKPVILFPIALLATLPQDEVEAILVHELAHIRRKDYLVNMFQHLMEIFFFFNPAVLWVSALIKTERENCCDDIAVAQTGNKRNYINALLSFQEYNIITPRYATGFTNKKYYLLQRVKRIIYNNNKTLNAMEKTFLASGLVLAGLLAAAFSQPQLRSHQKTNSVSQSVESSRIEKPVSPTTQIKDTIPVSANSILKEKSITTLNTILDGKRYDLKLKNDEVTELTIDGEKIPDGKIAGYKTITDSLVKRAIEERAQWMRESSLFEKAKLSYELSKLDAERSLVMAQKLKELAVMKDQQEMVLVQKLKELAVAKDQQPMLQDQKLKELAFVKDKLVMLEQQKLKELEIVRGDQQALALAQKLTELSAALPELKAQLMLKELAMIKDQQSLILAQKENQLVEQVKAQSLQSKFELEKEMALLSKMNSITSKQVAEQMEEAKRSMIRAKEMEKVSKTTLTEIINDLIREKIIKDKKDVSFTLNNNELIVNGVKQPEAIHQKLKEKYIKGPDWNFNYNNKQ